MNAWTPGAMLGSRRCGTPRILTTRGAAQRQRKCAEPVALSSSGPADVPLSLSAAWLGFVLPALRARRSCDSTASSSEVQGPERGKIRNLQKVQFSTFPQRLEQHVEKGGWGK